MNDLVQLAVDIYNKKTGEFSLEECHETLRQELLSVAGTDKIDYKTMRRLKPEIFEVLEVALDQLVERKIEDEFAGFAEVRNVNWGDSNVFMIDNPNLFEVYTIADGNNNLIRQRLENGSMTVSTVMRGVKVYEELYRFLSGRVDWIKTVNKVADSYNNKIYTLVYQAIYNGYSGLGSTYGITGSYDASTLSDLIQHVEAATGVSAEIIGTKNALGKIATAQVSDKMKDDYNVKGYYGVFNGTPMREIKQVHTPGTDTFAINDSFLVVVPVGAEPMVKIVVEGEALITDNPGGQNMDQSLEYTFQKKSGIGILTANKWGQYRLS